MNTVLNKIKKWPVYILLFPVFFVFHGYVDNFRLIPPGSALLLCGIYVGATIVITAVFYLLYKDLSKAALLSFFILAFDFFFGTVVDLLSELFPSSFMVKYSFLVPAFLVVMIFLFFFIQKRASLVRLNYYLNTLLILLLIIDAAVLSVRTIDNPKGWYKNANPEYALCDSCPKPDVYIIMLDEYAGLAELKDMFHYDNQPFFDSLTSRGFKTIGHSYSNYNYTPYSTASFLNMEYLDSQKTRNVKWGYKYAINKIDDNKAVNMFVSGGYRFFNCSPFMIAGQTPRIEGSFVPTGTKLITHATFLGRFEKDVMLNVANKLNLSWYLKRSMYVTHTGNEKLYSLTKKIAESEPLSKLVYTHLLMPHYPYYYDSSGRFRSFDELRNSSLDNSADYLSYLKYTNGQMISLMDHLLMHSATPPLIILLSDHGYRQGNTDTQYYFSSLLSVHLPGRNYRSYSDTVSNVNFLRMVLNTEFGMHLPLLEDKKFMIEF